MKVVGPITPELEKALKAAERLLRFRPRSVKELRIRLEQKGFEPAIYQQAIESLLQKRLLDDRAFVTFWISNRLQFKPMSRRRLLQELRMKGIDEDLLQSCLQEMDLPAEADLARRLLKKKAKGVNREDPVSLRRLQGYLQRRGFSYETIREVLSWDDE